MSDEVVQIKRYPNRRFYARNASKYVSLQDIEEMVSGGATVEIQDSQSGADITRAVLTQIIVERHPEKMSLFPPAMLHFILRSNDMMSHFLRDYFRQSLTYLEYLQQHGTAPDISQPMHWMKAWLDGFAHQAPGESAPAAASDAESQLASRVEQLERRLRELEGASPTKTDE